MLKMAVAAAGRLKSSRDSSVRTTVHQPPLPVATRLSCVAPTKSTACASTGTSASLLTASTTCAYSRDTQSTRPSSAGHTTPRGSAHTDLAATSYTTWTRLETRPTRHPVAPSRRQPLVAEVCSRRRLTRSAPPSTQGYPPRTGFRAGVEPEEGWGLAASSSPSSGRDPRGAAAQVGWGPTRAEMIDTVATPP